MSAVIEGLLYCWGKNLDYGQRLVADLSDQQMTQQPVAEPGTPANHPAWVFSHLNAYLPVISGLIKGEPVEDPKDHPFGMLSKPENDASIYLPKSELIDEFVSGHQQIKAALSGCDDSIFTNSVSIERWKNIMPTLGIALPYLMVCHENLHFGQLSAWRRIQEMPSV